MYVIKISEDGYTCKKLTSVTFASRMVCQKGMPGN